MMVFMSLVLVLIGQFCRDVIGRQNVKVVVIGRLLFCCYFRSVYCLLVSFEVMYESFVRCSVAVDISSEVLVLIPLGSNHLPSIECGGSCMCLSVCDKTASLFSTIESNS